MFNFMVSANPEAWNTTTFNWEKPRFLEYTSDELREQFKLLTPEKINLLKKIPTIFAIEQEERESKIGYIEEVSIRQNHYLIKFKIDSMIPNIPKQALKKLAGVLDIGDWELHRTHWAIKDVDLLQALADTNHIERDFLNIYLTFKNKLHVDLPKVATIKKNQIFIIHGRNEIVKNTVKNFISEIGLEPIILHEQASKGKTIIEKIEEYTDVSFAIALYTPCDTGNLKHDYDLEKKLYQRARQNVVLEHGFLMGKLGRSRVAALLQGEIEKPNDISGIVYIDFDKKNLWKDTLKKEIFAAGIDVGDIF